MKAEIIGRECRMTLSRAELVLLIGAMTGASAAIDDDEYFEELVGWTRAEVRALASQIADQARAIPWDDEV